MCGKTPGIFRFLHLLLSVRMHVLCESLVWDAVLRTGCPVADAI